MISRELEKWLESEKANGSIFDIIVYGSSLKGKLEPNDLDIAVVFTAGTLRERLAEVQRIKEGLKPLFGGRLDIKQLLLSDIFKPEFMARAGILLEGYSIFRRKSFAETIGFKPYSLFTYTLNGLKHSQKIALNYALSGRGSEGMLSKLGGERVARGAVKIPIGHSAEFEEFLKRNSIHYMKKNMLEEI